MHIEVTDCQRNIPTFEKPRSEKRPRQRNGQADENCKNIQTPEASKALLNREVRRLLDCH
jgi:hypothetical protein